MTTPNATPIVTTATAAPVIPPGAPTKPRKKSFRPRAKLLSKEVPKATSKSTTSTPLTNDPLWLDAFALDGELGLTSVKSVKEFNADAAGYVEMVEEEYSAISDVDKAYAKSLPRAAHAYYHHVLYWYKIALGAARHGIVSTAQNRLIQFVEGYGPIVAAGAGAYLAGLGDFEDATGVKHIMYAPEPNEQGHFGRATAENHSRYEHLPAPAFSLQRILEDINITTERGRVDENWDIGVITPVNRPQAEYEPDEDADADRILRARRIAQEEGHEVVLDPDLAAAAQPEEPEPQEPNLNGPTANLLGWRPAAVLTPSQLAEMRNIFEPGNRFFNQTERVNTTYALNRGVFEFVLRRLKEVKREIYRQNFKSKNYN